MIEYESLFYKLTSQPENEIVEFKAASNNFDINELGKYFSALSNEANIHSVDFAWLIMGVDDKTRKPVGTSFKNSNKALQSLKNDMSQHTTDNLIFRDIIPLEVEGKRILMFKIPASPRNIVMHWKGIAYGRDGESLKPMNQTKRDEIRNQLPYPDWSAELVTNATINDLDELALAKAKLMFKKVHASNIPAEEIESWSMEELLSSSKMMRDGQLTRAAILLLGKPSALSKIQPAVAQITWTLQDDEGIVEDYEHFTIPFLLTVDQVLAKVRNKTMRELPGGTLFPDTMKQYDDYTFREALHNCIAHQDYTMRQRITLVECPDKLYYSNCGTFIPGTLEKALEHKGPQLFYRNQCLCDGMVNFNMIDTVGRGIKKIFTEQRKRFFPMPDYDIDNQNKRICVTTYGSMIDERYSHLLKSGNHLSLQECVWLDAIQKQKPIAPAAVKHLKSRRLIEGRGNKLSITLKVAQMTNQVASYTRNQGLSYEALKKLILQFAKNMYPQGFKRSMVFECVEHSLPAAKDSKGKQLYLGRILKDMALEGLLRQDGRYWFFIDIDSTST